MSDDVLRQAAALMRERAEAATPSPWLADIRDDRRAWVFIYDEMDSLSLHGYPNDAEHIASWHPVVALAVADWLDSAAARAESKIANGGKADPVWSHEHAALAVARAYLGMSLGVSLVSDDSRCNARGDWGDRCTEDRGHRYAHYDASSDTSWTDRSEDHAEGCTCDACQPDDTAPERSRR